MKAPEEEDKASYWRALDWTSAAVHELPAGVLDGADAASAAACREMMEGLNEFADLCDRLGLDDHREYIESCRWHFDHYPHYLERRRHFASYESYTRERHGPLRVGLPPSPPRLLHRPT